MILNGNERANASKLAKHLLNTRDNEHVDLHELRGFVADNLFGALQESEAIAKGTRCQKHLFSLSLNPPPGIDVAVEVFEAAVNRIEEELGLSGQPRAIVFHEKEGRRHAHAVWSKIDGEKMRAINLSFYKRDLTAISKELFLEHGWQMPDGLRDHRKRDPLKFSHAEWQQAKRTGLDVKQVKALIRECWNVSDTRQSFENALREKGFWLAHGDRRSYGAVDWRGEIYSLSRITGAKSKEMQARLGETKEHRSIEETKAHIGALLTPRLQAWAKEMSAKASRANLAAQFQREQMVQRHRQVRADLKQRQEERWIAEEKLRAARTPTGIRGLWGWITGKNKKIRQENEAEIAKASSRDRSERQTVISGQLHERRGLQRGIVAARTKQQEALQELNQEIAHALTLGREPVMSSQRDQQRERQLHHRDRDEPDRSPL